ncbi:hypothetical protein B9Z55_015178 [Caenorhabditis nigoni]|uniref:F-box domain-containing protein n=1 Tax=Caenorhabditis nigoni TaxID=1611254 RepID=A0A2G5U996_9PELO|nr:hypothetical protein B9Z55_015178 [Caenorhabditis nigoni]
MEYGVLGKALEWGEMNWIENWETDRMMMVLLRTPFVVISEIISLLEPNEIVNASFCSKNLKSILKKHFRQRKPSKWRLFMRDCDSCGQVNIDKWECSRGVPVLSAKHILEQNESDHKLVETNGYKRDFSSEFPVLYFEDRVMGLKMIVEYATDLFNLDIYGLFIDTNGTWAINWINNRQEKMLECLWTVNPDYNSNVDEALDYVLRNARASDYFILEDNVSDNFRFNGKLGPIDYLYIPETGHWVTLQNLMNFDIVKIIIEESRLSVSDLNSFLRHWQAGGSHRLTFLELEFKNDMNFEFDEDLELVETGQTIDYLLSEGEIIQLNFGYSIQRMDGVKATISWKSLESRRFLMVVWHEGVQPIHQNNHIIYIHQEDLLE